jgi:capsular polysaccharide biosynthesis protein
MRLPDLAELREVATRVSRLAVDAASARRIYFSRDDARRRRVGNEDEVVRILRAHDFEIVRNDPAKPWEQVRLSRGAEFAVGLHGAALTNVIFMQKGTRLLELRHPDRQWNVYAKLADMFGVEYRSQTCTAAGTEPPASGGRPGNTDVIVDLDQLRENLRDGGTS